LINIAVPAVAEAVRSSRQQLHAQIAEALEAQSPELMDTQPPEGGGGAGASGGVITARIVFLEEKGCVRWDISAAPRRSGREYYGNEPK
jgi:hypothetical protein